MKGLWQSLAGQSFLALVPRVWPRISTSPLGLEIFRRKQTMASREACRVGKLNGTQQVVFQREDLSHCEGDLHHHEVEVILTYAKHRGSNSTTPLSGVVIFIDPRGSMYRGNAMALLYLL